MPSPDICRSAVLACAIAALVAAPATRSETPAAAMAAAMPRVLGPFQLFATVNYEASRPGLGHAVGYEFAERAVTAHVYVYDLGRAPVPEGTEAPVLRAQHRQMIEEVHHVFPRIARRIVEEHEVEGVAPALRCTDFRFDDADDTPGYSLACLTGVGGQFIKIRVTGPLAPDTVAASRRFAADAVAAVRDIARRR